jgi:hypothetical protein
LVRTALGKDKFEWVRRSAALEQLERSTRMLLKTLAEESHVTAADVDTSREDARWERRFASALPRLREAGLEVTDDVDAAAAEYVRLRAEWDGSVDSLRHFLGHPPEQIDVNK